MSISERIAKRILDELGISQQVIDTAVSLVENINVVENDDNVVINVALKNVTIVIDKDKNA